MLDNNNQVKREKEMLLIIMKVDSIFLGKSNLLSMTRVTKNICKQTNECQDRIKKLQEHRKDGIRDGSELLD